ncbi:hypothetical protein WS71_16820 [Burkholderia mayonis]|uniref:Uncharacterized protein n=1 Tax=Burkholderia mayonis TaxID=1385591 RepID=A0A1B4FZG5_9BURK|nr:hypothetical protein WS71_16820 [Burkholderia mayonis]KVE55873.1 hypothetical protein WS71_29680 [Burkholderia mayonis]
MVSTGTATAGDARSGSDRDASSRGAAWRLREMMREKPRPVIEPDASRMRTGAAGRNRTHRAPGRVAAPERRAAAGTRAFAFAS